MSTKQDLLESPEYSGNIKSVRVTKKGITDGYMPYMPEELSASARKALNHSLTMIMGHVADFHTLVLYILSKKYGHSIEEMLDAVMEHPETKNLTRHPILRDVWCNFTEEDIPKELQTHPNGLNIDEPPAPYYFRETELKSKVVETNNTQTADISKMKTKKTAPTKISSKTKDSHKTKNKIDEIFSDSD
jgi:hypothetical protein